VYLHGSQKTGVNNMSLSLYIEAVSNKLANGIRRIEAALITLYDIENATNERAISRKLQHISRNLMKAVTYFGLEEYEGISIKGEIKNSIAIATKTLSEILSAYNDGIDDPIGWGKNCMDIVATFSDATRKKTEGQE